MADDFQTLADGRYDLFEVIGSGGMASVYRAYDCRLGVPRAIKVMSPTYAQKPRVRARFEAEARTMAVLDHAAIVRVYDVGSSDETAWIVMELIEGGSLLQKIGSKGLPVDECLRHTARVLEALHVAHGHGVVHRDIKPHNVLLNLDGDALITDFGIARSTGRSDEGFTKTGTVMGTWAFMAPEQRVNAKGVDHTADLYGLGATLFTMATGQTPMDLFASDLDPEMLSDVAEPLRPIIRRATRYNRDDRYPSASAMLEDVLATRAQLGASTQVTPQAPSDTASTPLGGEPLAVPGLRGALDTVYVPEDDLRSAREEPPVGSSRAHDREETPPRFSANNSLTHEEVPLSPEQEPETRVRVRPNRDRTAFVLIIILVLIVGGTVKRLIKPSEDVAPEVPAAAEILSAPDLAATPTLDPGLVQDTIETKEAPETPLEAAPESRPPTAKPAQKVTTRSAPDAKPAAASPSPEIREPTLAEAPPVAPSPELDVRIPATARMGGYAIIQAEISNLTPLETQSFTVTAYYRPAGSAAYRKATLGRTRRTWSGRIEVTSDMAAGLELFITARSSTPNERLKELKVGSNRKPRSVRVSSP